MTVIRNFAIGLAAMTLIGAYFYWAPHLVSHLCHCDIFRGAVIAFVGPPILIAICSFTEALGSAIWHLITEG